MHMPAARGWSRVKHHSAPSLGNRSVTEREGRVPRTAGLRCQYQRTSVMRRMCVNAQAADRWYDGERRSRQPGAGKVKSRTNAEVAREIAEVLGRRDMRLVLHFDLNKTLLMVDPAGGKTQSQSPPSPGMDGERSKCLLTYSDFLHQELGDAEGRDNDMMKATRDQLKGSFTEEQQPGMSLRGELMALEQALRLPQGAGRSPLAEGAGLADRNSWYIIPGFFECLVALKKVGAEFSLVFRTFGSDLERVAVEYNAFCEGRHPCFVGVKMDGSDGMPDYRIHLREGGELGSNNVGSFFRDEEWIALVMGTLQNLYSREEVSALEKKGHPVYRSIGDVHKAVYSAVCPIQQPVSTSVADRVDWCNAVADGTLGGLKARANCCCLALRDYYPFWRYKLEAQDAGKLLPVDVSPDSKLWPVMFDDNVGRPDSKEGAHIADVRDAATGLSIPFDQTLNRYLVRAEPYLAVLKENTDADPSTPGSNCSGNYFLSGILRTLTREEHSRSSAGPEP